EKWKGQSVLLHFGAVNWESIVWVNGNKLGDHKGGYDAFSFDITDSLKDGENEITVRVVNPADRGTQPRGKQGKKPGGIFYTPATGIWQTVWLEPVPQSRIESLRIVQDANAGSVQVQIHGRGLTDKHRATVSALWDRWTTNGQVGYYKQVKVDGIVTANHELKINPINLWSPESPFLYDLSIDVLLDGAVVDHVQSYFALRNAAVGKDPKGATRILLNGKPYFQVG